MVYGDGAGFPLAEDVVAHELTHGVTNFTSNLFYFYQSGAINESFSDIWGEYVDQTNTRPGEMDSPADRWWLGEDVAGLDALRGTPLGTNAIRNMRDPGFFGHPDRMTSPNYFCQDTQFNPTGPNTGDEGACISTAASITMPPT